MPGLLKGMGTRDANASRVLSAFPPLLSIPLITGIVMRIASPLDDERHLLLGVSLFFLLASVLFY